MTKLKVAIIAGFALVCILFGGYFVVKQVKKDVNPPEILFDNTKIEVDIKAGKEELLKGVKAIDKEDGDVTQSVMIEEITSMVEPGICIANYVAFDSYKNITKEKRQIVFKNYKSPEFQIRKPLVVTTGKLSDILEHVVVHDSMEGDLSNRIKLVELESNTSSSYRNCELQVTNYLGDATYLPIVIELQDPGKSVNQPLSLQLTDYVVYTKKGEKPDYHKYLGSATILNKKYAFDNHNDPFTRAELDINQDIVLSAKEVQIVDEVDYETPGNYTVEFIYTNSEGYTATTTLYVVVRE